MVFHLWVLSSRNGARRLRNFFECCSGFQCCLTSLSNSLVPICLWSVFFLSCLVLSTFCDADLMMVATSLSSCSPGRFSKSRPCTVPARRRKRRVGSFRVVASRASVGQWLNRDRIL